MKFTDYYLSESFSYLTLAKSETTNIQEKDELAKAIDIVRNIRAKREAKQK